MQKGKCIKSDHKCLTVGKVYDLIPCVKEGFVKVRNNHGLLIGVHADKFKVLERVS